MELTNLHFNEDDLLWMVIAVENYMHEHNDCNNKIKEAHKIFNQIWYKLPVDEEIFLVSKPF